MSSGLETLNFHFRLSSKIHLHTFINENSKLSFSFIDQEEEAAPVQQEEEAEGQSHAKYFRLLYDIRGTEARA